MKVTKGQPKQEEKKVIAFYTGVELVFRDLESDRRFSLSGKGIYKGGYTFQDYLKLSEDKEGFIAFYEGDTINIEL